MIGALLFFLLGCGVTVVLMDVAAELRSGKHRKESESSQRIRRIYGSGTR